MARRVIDANIGIALVVPYAYSPRVASSWAIWQAGQDDLLTPGLWRYEVVSGLWRAMLARYVNPARLQPALDELFNLGVQEVEPTLDLHRRAVAWAERLQHGSTYDAHYVALADQLGVELWTADQRLTNRCRQLGIDWVRSIHED